MDRTLGRTVDTVKCASRSV
uniref:Uncharacterized protein n=1 Tax=Anopheles minimus TaxID=112268 RepID=A0A182WQA1_9DIPT